MDGSTSSSGRWEAVEDLEFLAEAVKDESVGAAQGILDNAIMGLAEDEIADGVAVVALSGKVGGYASNVGSSHRSSFHELELGVCVDSADVNGRRENVDAWGKDIDRSAEVGEVGTDVFIVGGADGDCEL